MSSRPPAPDDPGNGPPWGPFSIKETQALADIAGVPARVMTMAVGSDDPEALAADLLSGVGLVLLHKDSDWAGHFIALVPRKGGTVVELFDPLGGATSVETYLHGRRGDKRNGEPGDWLAYLLEELRAQGVRLTYNRHGPQEPDASTCALHSLARIGAHELEPSAWAKKARHIFTRQDE